MSKLILIARRQFHFEWTWRMFVVFQIAGLLMLIYSDVGSAQWNILPDFFDYRNQLQFEWDIFKERYWTRTSENWTALAFLFGPFTVAKAVDWIKQAKP